ncbi:hypothetical protein, conserved [Trypanosoma brucei gambiense DAL972]|uniref:Uncharacterized protein n=2 Tax=Trypanosoma brucei TaxID=5691 RepID=C9ZXP8_TRYB9|nr:hypothetical protein, conserved [Trypanosoma brucei gambiense DAL972]RHW70415.1 hypothetical protein DPX39_090022400 [Trypanosoma brucei equiperdum]CBH14193.1 hypothetical protein, conserved [Trypanosoma brucei gambiense DAL972]|eukprot:XP_011776463.1 hypothetical protein, conserved [Trypanosoma brucei gambiense DAL972]
MLISAADVSSAALREEIQRRKDFFALLNVVAHRMYTPTTVEWRLIDHCLGEINYRFADFSFLVGFLLVMPICRHKRTAFSRYVLPFYAGLVAYDNALRLTNPCPAVTFWNSVVLLDGHLGETARQIYAPKCFYKVENGHRQTGAPVRYATFLHLLWDTVSVTAGSLLLQTLLRYTFNRSSWMHESGGSTVTSLVISTRLFIWNVFALKSEDTSVGREYTLRLSLPHFIVSPGLVHSYRSRHLILSRSSFGSHMWYLAHFPWVYCLSSKGRSQGE